MLYIYDGLIFICAVYYTWELLIISLFYESYSNSDIVNYDTISATLSWNEALSSITYRNHLS